MYTRILSRTGNCMMNSFHPTPLLPIIKEDYDLSNATTQLLIADIACD
jgi:hypothetical protein